MSAAEETLQFTDAYHEAMVGHMLSDYEFFLRCKQSLRPGMCNRHPMTSETVKLLYEFYDNLPAPRKFTFDEFEGHLAQTFVSDRVKFERLSDFTRRCTVTSKNVGLDVISRDMTGFIQLAHMVQSTIEMKHLLNKGEYFRARSFFQKSAQDLSQMSFEQDEAADFTNLQELYAKLDVNRAGGCTIGHRDFDALLVPQEKGQGTGGLTKGTSTVLIGSTNAGKTTCVITVASANMISGKSVLLVTHEKNQEDVQDMVVRSIMGATTSEMAARVTSEEAKLVSHLINKYLTYVSYVRAGEMYVENVISMIRTKIEQRVNKTGKGYDLLIVDYPGKLMSTHFSSKNSKEHTEQAYVYDQLMLMGKEYGMHVFLPAQVNREGYKVNRGDDGRALDESDIAKSYDITTNADNVISINRSDDDISRGIVKFFITKCKTSKTKSWFVSRSDYARVRTHWPGYKHKSYVDKLQSTVLEPGMQMSSEMLNNMFPDPDAGKKRQA